MTVNWVRIARVVLAAIPGAAGGFIVALSYAAAVVVSPIIFLIGGSIGPALPLLALGVSFKRALVYGLVSTLFGAWPLSASPFSASQQDFALALVISATLAVLAAKIHQHTQNDSRFRNSLSVLAAIPIAVCLGYWISDMRDPDVFFVGWSAWAVLPGVVGLDTPRCAGWD